MWQETRVAPRYNTRLICRILPANIDSTNKLPRQTIGYTRDISASGIAAVVSTIGPEKQYLTSRDSPLLVEIDFASGSIAMETTYVRMERLTRTHYHQDEGYLVCFSIRTMTKAARGRFEEYLAAMG